MTNLPVVMSYSAASRPVQLPTIDEQATLFLPPPFVPAGPPAAPPISHPIFRPPQRQTIDARAPVFVPPPFALAGPSVYPTIPLPVSQSDMDSELPLRWFVEFPSSAAAIFSTRDGTYPKRCLPNPPPPRIVRSDRARDIVQTQQHLHKSFPELVRKIKDPRGWDDLRQYWDAADLWELGPEFCYWVIKGFAGSIVEWRRNAHVIIDSWATHWADRVNEMTLWNTRHFPITELPYPLWDNVFLGDLLTDECNLLFAAMNHYRHGRLAKHYEDEHRFMAAQAQSQALGRIPIAAHDRLHHQVPASAGSQIVAHGGTVIDQHLPNFGPPIMPTRPNVQTYANFMDAQRHPPQNPTSDDNPHREFRPRGLSVDSTRSGRGGYRIGRGAHNGRNLNGSQRTSPPRLADMPGSTQYHDNNHRNISDPNRALPPADLGVQDPRQYQRQNQDTGANIISRRGTMLSNDARVLNGAPFDEETPSRVFADRVVPSVTTPPKIASPSTPSIADQANHVTRSTAQLQPSLPVTETTTSAGNTQPILKEHSNNSATFIYDNTRSKFPLPLRMEQKIRTAHIGGAVAAEFWNHRVKELMAECGEVESVHGVNLGETQIPSMFVAFKDENSMHKAINQLDNREIAPGRFIRVSFPRSRDRSGSHTSQRGYQYEQTGGNDFRSQENRRYSRGHGSTVVFHHRQVSGLSELRASVGAMMRPDPISVPFSEQLPLKCVENISSGAVEKQSGMTGMGKENAPYERFRGMMKDDSPTKFSQTSRSTKSKSKAKKSRQNTSTKPTPVATPVKNHPHNSSNMQYNTQRETEQSFGALPENTSKSHRDLESRACTNNALKENMRPSTAYSTPPKSMQTVRDSVPSSTNSNAEHRKENKEESLSSTTQSLSPKSKENEVQNPALSAKQLGSEIANMPDKSSRSATPVSTNESDMQADLASNADQQTVLFIPQRSKGTNNTETKKNINLKESSPDVSPTIDEKVDVQPLISVISVAVETTTEDIYPPKKGKKPNKSKKINDSSRAEDSLPKGISFLTDSSVSGTFSGTFPSATPQNSLFTPSSSFDTVSSRNTGDVLSESSVHSTNEDHRKKSRELDKEQNQHSSAKPELNEVEEVRRLSKNVVPQSNDMTANTRRQGPNGKNQLQGHGKSKSNGSVVNNQPLRKADEDRYLNTNKTSEHANQSKGEVSESSSMEVTKLHMSTPTIDLGNQAEFPSLEAAILPAATTVDDKRSCPSDTASKSVPTESATDKKKGRMNPKVAVPRCFEVPRTQAPTSIPESPDESMRIGSETWPFVKSFKVL